MDHPNAIEANTPGAESSRTHPDPSTCHNLTEVMDAAKANAHHLAGEAVPKLKQAVRTVAYDVVYGATFGVCFAAAFAREVAPAALKHGLARGARAGREAGERTAAAFTAPAPAEVPAEAPILVECPAPA